MKHATPGPWRVGDFWLNADAKNPKMVAIWGSGRGIVPGIIDAAVCLISDASTYSDEDAANARLIASAPDLLEALRPFARWASDLPKDIVPGDSFNVSSLSLNDLLRARDLIARIDRGAA